MTADRCARYQLAGSAWTMGGVGLAALAAATALSPLDLTDYVRERHGVDLDALDVAR